ncbi:MAG TPA: PTS system mannose/fructose/sorbose family transporter subunit IID [Gemmatimonadales bacterium]|jgi:mannose/fructose/N-acetylgalactosamine-specific phosphotransferase system component IID
MKARTEALLRLMAVQASYTYERMLGIGVGHASAPLLRDVFATRTVRERRDAVARSADFFNSHPYLAGVAVGAEVRAEQQGVPGAMISRLRMALSGPLGSLGDQLIWAGWVPALIGATLVLAPWAGIWAIVTLVLVHNLLRFWVMSWGLDLGLREGLQVGAALQRSWLPRVADDAQRVAAFAVGLALPIVAWRLLVGANHVGAAITIATGVIGAVLTLLPATRRRITGLRIGLVLLGLAVLYVGGTS